MKGVLLISNFLFQNGNGSKTVCEELAERLAEDRTHVITASSKAKKVPRLFDMLQTVWERRHEYDVAHVAIFSGPAFVWAEATCAVLRQLGKPFAVTLHGGNLPEFSKTNPGRVRRVLRSADTILAPSEYLRQLMAEYGKSIQLMPNAVELDRYIFRRRTFAAPSLVWLRAFDHIYNPTLAPRVLRLIADEFPDAQLTMIGPDKGDGSLAETQQVARELAIESRICFAGGVDKEEVPQWLGRGDVFLNTTNIDNTPVSMIEAMACGLCVVSTDVGGIPYLVEDGRHALLVPPDNAHVMAENVKRLLRQPDLAQTLSENARAKVVDFDWSVVLPKWQSLFLRLAGEKQLVA